MSKKKKKRRKTQIAQEQLHLGPEIQNEFKSFIINITKYAFAQGNKLHLPLECAHLCLQIIKRYRANNHISYDISTSNKHLPLLFSHNLSFHTSLLSSFFLSAVHRYFEAINIGNNQF